MNGISQGKWCIDIERCDETGTYSWWDDYEMKCWNGKDLSET